MMETGGFKGRSREIVRGELHAWIEARLGVPASHIVNQYGMTELGSQFYDSILARPREPRRKIGPPWTRVRTLDPKSGLEAEPGGLGVLTIHDLANTGSVAAIATADLGRRIALDLATPGFEVVGDDGKELVVDEPSNGGVLDDRSAGAFPGPVDDPGRHRPMESSERAASRRLVNGARSRPAECAGTSSEPECRSAARWSSEFRRWR